MECPKCHKLLPDNYRFCPNCRTRLVQLPEPLNYSKNQGENKSSAISNIKVDDFRIVKNKLTWDVVKGEVARTIRSSEFDTLSGVSGIIIPEGIRAEIYIDGVLKASLGSGIYDFVEDAEIDEVLNRRIVNWKSLYGIGAKLIRGVAKLISGSKVKDNIDRKACNNNNFKSLNEVIDSLRTNSIITVYLMVDRQFSLLFGTTQGIKNDGLDFNPYRIKTKYLDVSVGLSLLFEVDDFKEIIRNFLLSQDRVTTSDVQALLSKYISDILQNHLRNIDIEKEGLPSDLNTQIALDLQSLSGYLMGFKVVGIGKITYKSEELDRLYTVAKELYCGEKEIDFLHRTNEFKNRLATVDNEQRIYEAKNALEVKIALDEINHDELLHEEEKRLFQTLLTQQRCISEAKTKMESDKALSDIRQTGLLNDDEELALKESIEFKKFDRENIAEAMRAQSIASSVKQRLDIQAELNGLRFVKNIDFEKLKVEQNSDLDLLKKSKSIQLGDAEFEAKKHDYANKSEELDITSLIYGKQYQIKKKELEDKIELSLTAFRAEMQSEEESAEHGNRILKTNLEGRKIEDEYNWDKKVREEKFARQKRLEELELSSLEKQTVDRLDHDNRVKDLDIIERKRNGALDALAKIKATQEAAKANDFRRKMEEETLAARERENNAIREQELKLKDLDLHDKHDLRLHTLEEHKLDVEKEMSDTQLVAKNLANLDVGAQTAYVSQFSSAKENELLKNRVEDIKSERESQKAEQLRREAAMKEDSKNMINTILAEFHKKDEVNMDLAKHLMEMTKSAVGQKSDDIKEEKDYERIRQREDMDRMERIMTHHADERHDIEGQRYDDLQTAKEEYRQQMMHQQQRLDEQQDKALNYTTRVNSSDKPKKNESVSESYLVKDMGISFVLSQLVGLVANGVLNKRSIIVYHNNEVYAEDIPELKPIFDKCNFIVCPKCHFKVTEKVKFCPNCGEDLY